MIGQVIWFQDFFPGEARGGFFDELNSFVQEIVPNSKYNIIEQLGIDLKGYNFDGANVDLVCSVPGRHKNTEKYGLGRLNTLLENKKYTNFTYQCSSVGSISSASKDEFCSSFTNNTDCTADIIFPSQRGVQDSHLGTDGAGVFFLQEKAYQSSQFLQNSLCNIEGPEKFEVISGHLSHSKVLIVHNDYLIDDESILYIGSHNFSTAA